MRIVAENNRVTDLQEEERIAFSVLQQRGWLVNGFETKLPVFMLVSVPGLHQAAAARIKDAVETTLLHSRRALKYGIGLGFLAGVISEAARLAPRSFVTFTVRVLLVLGALELIEACTRRLLLHRVRRALQNDGQA